LVLFSGCGGGKKPKYTEEELAKIPLARRTGLPKASGGFVLAVGDETITADEIVLPLIEDSRPFAQRSSFEQFKEEARPGLERFLITMVSDILLYQQAKEHTGVDEEALEKAAEREVRKFVVSFGSDYARAEQALMQDGMDWQSFKEYQKKVVLTQSYIASQLPKVRPITYSELVDTYNEMKKDESFSIQAMLKFWLVDIEAAKLEVADANQSRLEQAKRLANELMGQIQAGKDPGKLAEKRSGVSFIDHSEGVRPESLEKPYDILVAEAEKIKPGQIAGPIEAGEHIFIMKLEGKQPKGVRPLEEVQKEVKAKILSDRWKEAVGELTAKLVQQAALSNMDAFIDFCLEKIYRLSEQKVGE
jgi:hypothetical protein